MTTPATPPNTELLEAITTGDVEALKQMVSSAGSVGFRKLCETVMDSRGCTAWLLAVMAEDISVANYLIKQGASIEEKNVHGETPLQYAAKNSPSEFMQLFYYGEVLLTKQQIEERMKKFGSKLQFGRLASVANLEKKPHLESKVVANLEEKQPDFASKLEELKISMKKEFEEEMNTLRRSVENQKTEYEKKVNLHEKEIQILKLRAEQQKKGYNEKLDVLNKKLEGLCQNQ